MYEFDLKTFLNVVWKSRKRILINCGIAAVAAFVVAFSIPKEYLASASLASEVQGEDGMMGGLGSLASFAGVNLNSGTDAIVPVLYPDVVRSNKFLVGLLYVDVQTIDGSLKTDYVTYLREKTSDPWWTLPMKWIGRMKSLLFPSEDFAGDFASPDGKINPFCMRPQDASILEKMRGLINCKVDDETQVITLQARAQDPLVAAIMVDSVRVHLQNFITQYQTSKARVDLDFYLKLEKDAKKAYEEAQREYAEYSDSHMGSILHSYTTKQESLENELQLAYTAYSQVKQQVQMAAAKVQEQTPAFTEIEGVSVPVLPQSPKKMLIFFAFVFLTFVGTVGWLYVKLLFFHHG